MDVVFDDGKCSAFVALKMPKLMFYKIKKWLEEHKEVHGTAALNMSELIRTACWKYITETPPEEKR